MTLQAHPSIFYGAKESVFPLPLQLKFAQSSEIKEIIFLRYQNKKPGPGTQLSGRALAQQAPGPGLHPQHRKEKGTWASRLSPLTHENGLKPSIALPEIHETGSSRSCQNQHLPSQCMHRLKMEVRQRTQ
jgi:hypothetical protein